MHYYFPQFIVKPKAAKCCYGSNNQNHHIREKKKKGKRALSRQSNLINNRNEGKACDYVNWEVRVPALKTESRKSI